jgi:glycosyltransferase involved in cell wall biosynthesis
MLDGETGLLVPPGDPDALAAAIAKLLQAPEMAAEMGAAGRRRVIARYRVETMARRVEELYDAVLGTRAA